MKVSAIMLITSLLLIWVAAANAVEGDIILGTWDNEEKDAKIEIFKCAEKYCGKIVWINKPVYEANEDAARTGLPRTDDENPNPVFRNRPIVGLEIMSGFDYAGRYQWAGGTVYDPKSGYTYRGKMTLVSKNRLDLRGYVLFSFFGRTSAWTRAGH
jgi:uncharacterized protein (DUF2147 family)